MVFITCCCRLHLDLYTPAPIGGIRRFTNCVFFLICYSMHKIVQIGAHHRFLCLRPPPPPPRVLRAPNCKQRACFYTSDGIFQTLDTKSCVELVTFTYHPVQGLDYVHFSTCSLLLLRLLLLLHRSFILSCVRVFRQCCYFLLNVYVISTDRILIT